MDFNGSNVEVIEAGITATVHCIAVDVTGKNVVMLANFGIRHDLSLRYHNLSHNNKTYHMIDLI